MTDPTTDRGAGRDPRLHPQALAVLEEQADFDPMTSVTDAEIAEVRDEQREGALQEPREDVAEVRDVEVGGVPCRLVRPADAELPVLVYLHGGGFVLGDLDTHEGQVRRLANLSGWAVLAVHYRRPPEDRFPAALDDAVAVLDGLLADPGSLGVDAARVVVIGDSAGANLAIGTARRRPGRLAGAVLVYPFLDPETSSASYSSRDGGLDREDAQWFWGHYVPDDQDLHDPDLAPLHAEDLGSLPPTLVQTAECDTLADEGLALVERARGQGAQVDHTTYPGMIHGFWRRPEAFDAATEALEETVRWLGGLEPVGRD